MSNNLQTSLEEFCPICHEYTEDCDGHPESSYQDHCPGCGADRFQQCECVAIERYEEGRR